MKRPEGSTFAAVLPFALAIFTFGVIYGTVARRAAEPLGVLLSSVLIFSGGLQFTIVGLSVAGAQAGALIAAALTLNARHVLLGAVLRPRIQKSAIKRAGLAWFLVDETTGLALNARNPAATLLSRDARVTSPGFAEPPPASPGHPSRPCDRSPPLSSRFCSWDLRRCRARIARWR
jgi:predicted branched-subunit amino acid permease